MLPSYSTHFFTLEKIFFDVTTQGVRSQWGERGEFWEVEVEIHFSVPSVYVRDLTHTCGFLGIRCLYDLKIVGL